MEEKLWTMLEQLRRLEYEFNLLIEVFKEVRGT